MTVIDYTDMIFNSLMNHSYHVYTIHCTQKKNYLLYNNIKCTEYCLNIVFYSTIYRASHIILCYLQALTPKYAHNTQKTEYFLEENFYKNLLRFLKLIHCF